MEEKSLNKEELKKLNKEMSWSNETHIEISE